MWNQNKRNVWRFFIRDTGLFVDSADSRSARSTKSAGDFKIRLYVLLLGILCLWGLIFEWSGSHLGAASSQDRVGLLIVHGSGDQITRCVELEDGEVEISGEELLHRSGLTVLFDYHPTEGAAVCKIEGEGCDAENCFCECQGETCLYWSYWHLQEEGWEYSGGMNGGASNYKVGDGDVDAWFWGGAPGSPPPAAAFADICPAAEETPSPTPTDDISTPTETLTPSSNDTATVTPSPTGTFVPNPYVNFWSDPAEIQAGECATLRWQTDQVKAVFLDERGMPGTGAMSVCPCETLQYVLRVVYLDDTQENFSTQVDVTGTCISSGNVMNSPLATPTAPLRLPPTMMSLPSPTVRPVTSTPSPTLTPLPTLPSFPDATFTLTASPPISSNLPVSPLQTPLAVIPDLDESNVITLSGAIEPSATLGVIETTTESSTVTTLEQVWGGYMAFGFLLMLIGSGYLVVQKWQR
ncbi:MAG: hypothetical protein JXA33_21820 [Anaerolineae bacterium]|nr:hypothetical protein [Anaerolineae bacterium]